MSKWEYCVVGPIKDNWGGWYPYLSYLTRYGYQLKLIRREQGLSEDDVLAKTIAELGLAGWEMVGSGNVPQGFKTHILYFKRPIPE
jgi:hypothetical protein